MSEIGKRITAITNEGLSPRLKDYGFRKRGVNYCRTDGDSIQVVTVQSSQWNNADSGRFRVNFGVHYPNVARLLYESDRMPKFPTESYCILRAIWSVPDRWWTVDSTTITADLAVNLGEH